MTEEQTMKSCDLHCDLFSEYLDRRLPVSEVAEFEVHQKNCAKCRAEYQTFSTSSETLALWLQHTSAFNGDVDTLGETADGRERLDTGAPPAAVPPPIRKSGQRPILDYAVALAAVIVFALAISQWWSSSPRNSPLTEDAEPDRTHGDENEIPKEKPTEEEIQKTLERDVPRLSSEEFAVRAEAQKNIEKLGFAAEEAVQIVLKKTTDPEVQSRLLSILQVFALQSEEIYALQQIKKNTPFPKTNVDRIVVAEVGTIADAISLIAQQAGLVIEFYSKDKELARLTNEQAAHRFGGFNSPQRALSDFLFPFDADYVVDEGKIVIVRMMPAVFFAKLEQQFTEPSPYYISVEIDAFDRPRINHWVSVMKYLQDKFAEGEETRAKWVSILTCRIDDATQTEQRRGMAMRALCAFLLQRDKAPLEVDRICIRYATDSKAPRLIWIEAITGLAKATSDEALDAQMHLLETSTDAQKELLAKIESNKHWQYGSYRKICDSAERRKQFSETLRKLGKSADTDIAIRALSILAYMGDETAYDDLLKVPDPKDMTTIRIYLTALSRRTIPGLDPQKTPERFDAFARHNVPQVRALYSYLKGYSAGGVERLPDVEALLPLLSDSEPVVRNFAVDGLRVIYHGSAATPFREGLQTIRTRLEEMAKSEKDSRVKTKIETSLNDMLKE
jgi:hypothetical protein